LNVRICEENSDDAIRIVTTAGVHPYNAGRLPGESDVSRLKALVSSHGRHVLAIGECGLDYSDGFPEVESQKAWFEAQVAVAVEMNKPLFVHTRLAFDDTRRIWEDAKVRNGGTHGQGHLPRVMPRVMVHCFTGSLEELKYYVNEGFWISVSGYICKAGPKNQSSVELYENLRLVPEDRLCVETDAPYMGFDASKALYIQHADSPEGTMSSMSSKEKKRIKSKEYPNTPCSIVKVVKRVAEGLGKTEGEVREMGRRNAEAFFGF
jgi:TatD DNase family protein